MINVNPPLSPLTFTPYLHFRPFDTENTHSQRDRWSPQHQASHWRLIVDHGTPFKTIEEIKTLPRRLSALKDSSKLKIHNENKNWHTVLAVTCKSPWRATIAVHHCPASGKCQRGGSPSSRHSQKSRSPSIPSQLEITSLNRRGGSYGQSPQSTHRLELSAACYASSPRGPTTSRHRG